MSEEKKQSEKSEVEWLREEVGKLTEALIQRSSAPRCCGGCNYPHYIYNYPNTITYGAVPAGNWTISGSNWIGT